MYSKFSDAITRGLNAFAIRMRPALAFACVGMLLSTLGACATAPTAIEFDAAAAAAQQNDLGALHAGDAILIVVVGPISTGGGYEFRQINESGTGFAAGAVKLAFGAWGVGDKMVRPADDKSSVWVLKDEINFLIKKVPAGRYAATQVTWNTFNGYSSGSAWACRREGASTFDIKPGTITLVSSRDSFPAGVVTRLSNTHSEEEVLAQFERTRASYPNLIGKPVMASPEWLTSWTPKSGLFNDGCNSFEEGTMTVTPILSAVNHSPPDELERAAIAAALENLKAKKAQLPAEGGNEP